MSHTLTIRPLQFQHDVRFTRSFKHIGDMPPIPRQGDTIIWDECMEGQQVQRVDYAYLRGTGMGILDKRRYYTHITIWVSK